MITLCVNLVVDVGYWLFIVDIDGSSMYNDGCMLKCDGMCKCGVTENLGP